MALALDIVEPLMVSEADVAPTQLLVNIILAPPVADELFLLHADKKKMPAPRRASISLEDGMVVMPTETKKSFQGKDHKS